VYAININWTLSKKNLQNFYRFSTHKIRSGSGTIIPYPDPSWPKSSGPTIYCGLKKGILCVKGKICGLKREYVGVKDGGYCEIKRGI
jgi:hypothetical protein